MIVFRALQGFSGGVMIPLAFTIILSMLPPSKHAMGLAGFAVTATFAPAIGPTIGGYFTDSYGWPYCFYVNLAPGAVMLGALWYGLPKSAMRLGLLAKGDWRGIALMAVGLAAFQTVLDDGNVYDWFGSPFIVKLSLVAAVALGTFVVLEFLTPAPLVNFRLLGRRNFGLGTLGNFLLGFALYASAYLLPQYLAVTQGFDAEQSGEVVAWTGLPQLLVIRLFRPARRRPHRRHSAGRVAQKGRRFQRRGALASLECRHVTRMRHVCPVSSAIRASAKTAPWRGCSLSVRPCRFRGVYSFVPSDVAGGGTAT
jgi:DHA2 family multidrug resistance protein